LSAIARRLIEMSVSYRSASLPARTRSVGSSVPWTGRERMYHATMAVRGADIYYDADVVAFVVVVEGPTVRTAGGTHEPFSAASCGQY